MGQAALPFGHGRVAAEVSRSSWPAPTIALALMTGFVGVIASVGAVFVIDVPVEAAAQPLPALGASSASASH
jgi:hypothetical protein